MEEQIARRRRRRVNRPLDRRKRLEFLRPLVRMEAIPEIAADAGDARQPAGKIAKSDSLDEIVEPTEHGADLRERGLFARDGDDEKDRRRDSGASTLCASIGTLSQFLPDIFEFSACSEPIQGRISRSQAGTQQR